MAARSGEVASADSGVGVGGTPRAERASTDGCHGLDRSLGEGATVDATPNVAAECGGLLSASRVV